MRYFVDFGREHIDIDFVSPQVGRLRRRVKQFVIFNISPPMAAQFKAYSIVVEEGSVFRWNKSRDNNKQRDQILSNEEEKDLLMQMLKSEIW